MITARPTITFSAVCLVALMAVAMHTTPAAAANPQITSIDPPVVAQGDTVMITLKGRELPTGTVIVEFFPQQIAFLDVLAASPEEIVVQIKVPNLAPPGEYNLLVYNHLGVEAFAEGMLQVSSSVLTPIFRDYDPKIIADAAGGFALMLTGETITQAAVQQMRMEWNRGSEKLTGVETAFAMADAGTVVCAVTGELKQGVLRGRIFLNDKPIYLVEVTLELDQATIIGVAPASHLAAADSYVFRVIGTGFSERFLHGMWVELSSPEMTMRPRTTELLDPASILVKFSGPLPVGDYHLSVASGETVVFEDIISLTVVEDYVEPGPAAFPGEVAPGTIPAGSAETPQREPATGSADESETAAAEIVDGQAEAGQDASALITSVSPTTLTAGLGACRIDVTGQGLSAAVFERLVPTLSINRIKAELMLMSTGMGSYTWVFQPGEEGWEPGAGGELTVYDPAKEVPYFAAAVTVAEAEMPELIVPPETAIDKEDWYVETAEVLQRDGQSQLVVKFASGGERWDPALLGGSFTLLPLDSAMTAYFGNLTLSGTLEFSRGDRGAAVGQCPGNFVTGDLLVEVQYGDSPAEISILELRADSPRASLVAVPSGSLALDPVSGEVSGEELAWTISLAPLIVKDASFIRPVFDPRPLRPTSASAITASGQNVTVAIDPAAWSGRLADVGELLVAFKSSIELNWRSQPSGTINVSRGRAEKHEQAESVPTPDLQEIEIELESQLVLLTDAGFVISYFVPPGSMLPENLAEMTVSSGNLLLDKNIASFELTAESDASGDRAKMLIGFRRDAEALPQMAYELLCSELIAADEVELLIAWPQSAIKHRVIADFE